MTDRTLPHLFPSADREVFDATRRSLARHRDSPRRARRSRSSRPISRRSPTFGASATSRRRRRKRLLVVLTDGEIAAGLGRAARTALRAAARDARRVRPRLGRRRARLHRGCAGAAVPARRVLARRPGRARGDGVRQHVLGARSGSGDRDGPRRARLWPDGRSRRAGRTHRRSRRTSRLPRCYRSCCCSGAATARARSSTSCAAPPRGTTARRRRETRSRPCTRSRGSRSREPPRGSRCRGRSAPPRRRARAAPFCPATARRIRHSVSAARSTSVPCCSYHSTSIASSRTVPALLHEPRRIVRSDGKLRVTRVVRAGNSHHRSPPNSIPFTSVSE